MIHIESDWDAVIRELDALDSMPTMKMRQRLDRVLEMAYEDTVAATHVVTGSLKASAKKSSKTNKALKRWEGTISMGGSSTGPRGVVDYAIYEKERGGSHNFFGTLPLLHPFFVRALKRGLNDG